MSELSEILRKEYKKKEKKKPIDFSMLMEMVEQLYDAIEPEVMGEGIKPTSDSEVADMSKVSIEQMLGALHINIEQWGNPTAGEGGEHIDRKILRNYVSTLTNSQNPDEILKAIASSLDNLRTQTPDRQEGVCNLSKTISVIQLMHTLSRIFKEYGPTTAGFMMEGFLSAVFPGGQVVPVTAAEGIQDFIIENPTEHRFYSLKNIGLGADVTGSLANLIKGLNASPDGVMTYYIFGKSESGGVLESLTIHKFDINEENMRDLFVDDEHYQITLLRMEHGVHLPGAIEHYLSGKELTHSEREKESRRLKKRLSGKTKFAIKKGRYSTSENLVAILTIDDQSLLEIANESLGDIKNQLMEIQQRYVSMVYDMNKYLSSMDSASAESFKKEAIIFDNSVQTNVQGDDSCTPPEDLT